MTQNNLAVAYLDRIRGEQAENIEQAIHYLQQAVEVRTQAAFPIDWASTQNNLAIAYRDRIRGERAENIEQAIGHFQQALDVYTSEAFPYRCRTIAGPLAVIYSHQLLWAKAHIWYQTAIQAAEIIYRSTAQPKDQQREIATNTGLYDGIITACMNLSDEDRYRRDGLSYAEGGKARTFLDQMGQADFPPPPGIPPDIIRQERELLEQLRQLDQTVPSASRLIDAGTASPEREVMSEQALARQRRSLLDRLDQLWDDMLERYSQSGEYIDLRRSKTPDWDELSGLVDDLEPDAALVTFYTLDEEIITFVLQTGMEAPTIFRRPISREQLFYRYLMPYRDEVLDHRISEESGRTPTHSWLELGEVLLAPLMETLKEGGLVYFVPHGLLHTLPLHALTVQGEPFIKQHPVVYAPSAGVLIRVLEQTPHQASNNGTLVMGYTPNPDPDEQAIFLGEAHILAERFNCQPVLDDQATPDALRELAPVVNHIHLSCHGHFDQQDPMQSGVLLADKEVFTARDWMRLQLRADLVTLSACETGFSKVGRGDEIVGLSRALLYAGASAALLTLWSVSAASTLEWMLNFYTAALDESADKQPTRAQAFRQATLALREKHPDPFYWAPFILVGDWR